MVDSANIALVAANLVPSDFKMASSKIAENTSDLTAGISSAKEEYPSSLVYKLAASDAAKFNLSKRGMWQILIGMDY